MFGDILTVPELLVRENVATVPGIDGRKMSKSYDNFIWLLDTPESTQEEDQDDCDWCTSYRSS